MASHPLEDMDKQLRERVADGVKFKQILVGEWEGSNGGLNHTLYGLSEDGCVYRYSVRSAGWLWLR